MGVLGNLDHERFCQATHKRVWAGEKRASAITAAYRETMYSGVQSGDAALAPNARRLANRKDVAARLAELAAYAAKLSGLDASWAMVQLAQRVADFNLDDYLTPGGMGERYFDIAHCSREQLGRLGELSIEEEIISAGEETLRKVRKTKLKPYDPASIIGLMARISGWETPKRIEATGKDGAPLIPEYTDEQRAKALAVFLAKSGQGAAA